MKVNLDDLIYGHIYTIAAGIENTCDNCGASLSEVILLGKYDGMQGDIHWFSVYPYSCLSCRATIAFFRIINSDITKEMKGLKK